MNQYAQEAGLVSRTSSIITGLNFLSTFTLGLTNTTHATLKQLVAFLNSNFDTNISPQALDQRINEQAVTFLTFCLTKAIEISVKKIHIDNHLLSAFKHIFIIDSSNFELHPSLKEIFKGSGGDASVSSMRIQFIFDYITGNLHIEMGDVRTTDAKTLYSIVKERKMNSFGNSLYLQDLGYFSTETFIEIVNANDLFISKLKFNVTVLDSKGTEINIYQLLRRKLKKIDIQIQIGHLKCRLVGMKLSKKDRNQRIKDAQEEVKKRKRKNISIEYKLFLSYGLFITNLNSNYSPLTTYTIYRLRWQIELVFKSWKSILEIHKIRSGKELRVLCEVLGKLIMAIILLGIYRSVNCNFQEPLSFYQVMQYMKALICSWMQAIIAGFIQQQMFFLKTFSQLKRFCSKRKQKTRNRIEDSLDNLY